MTETQPAGTALTNPAILFLDGEWEAWARGVEREYHAPVKHPANPVLRSDGPWEWGVRPICVAYDADAGRFQCWYNAHRKIAGATSGFHMAYATSADGLDWDKPALGLVECDGSRANNLVLLDAANLQAVRDPRDPDPARRYKAMYWGRGPATDGIFNRWMGADGPWGFCAAYSEDGAHWRPDPENPIIQGENDRQDLLGWDPRHQAYVAYVRPDYTKPPKPFVPTERDRSDVIGPGKRYVRTIARSTSGDFRHWSALDQVLVPDAGDPPTAEFYYLAARPYRDLYVGMLAVYIPPADEPIVRSLGTKYGELVWSHDGVNWRRAPGRRPFLRCGPRGAWDGGFVDPTGPVIAGDEVRIYYGAWNGDHRETRRYRRGEAPMEEAQRAAHGGLATLRLDGFASLTAGAEWGEVQTRAFRFDGADLALNAQARGGAVVAELTDPAGVPLPGFTADDAQPFYDDDAVRHVLRWRGAASLGALRGRWLAVRLRLLQAQLYSITVS